MGKEVSDRYLIVWRSLEMREVRKMPRNGIIEGKQPKLDRFEDSDGGYRFGARGYVDLPIVLVR